MKTIINIIIVTAIALFALSSCSDWLDVNPRSEIKESVLFSSEDGFKKALTGAYILMAQNDLYGRNTSMFMPEFLARHWTIPAASSTSASQNRMNRLANFDYSHSDVEPLINSVWLSYFKVIAQLNDILQHLENSQVSFENNNDALIKGEALGLRAFLHLDVLRLFGPVPSTGNQSGIAIPYVTEKTKDPSKLTSIPYSEVIKNIEADLDAAEKILLNADPILRHNNAILNNPGLSNRPEELLDTWRCYRQDRFNYYACLGTKARLYQWSGDKTKAAEYAKKVISAVNSNNSTKFALAKESDYIQSSSVNLTMHSEQLFGISNPDMLSTMRLLFDSGTGTTLAQTVALMNTCYENTVSPSDIRYKPSNQPARYWEERTYQNSVRVNHFKKFTGNDMISPNYRVPLLRLAEMYFIVIENSPLAEAATYFSTFRIARSLDISVEATSMTDESARRTRLEREHRKDFFGEGQMFFFYKRLNYASYTWPANFALPAGAYVVPKPKAQISFE